jgi:hypothetical protein
MNNLSEEKLILGAVMAWEHCNNVNVTGSGQVSISGSPTMIDGVNFLQHIHTISSGGDTGSVVKT